MKKKVLLIVAVLLVGAAGLYAWKMKTKSKDVVVAYPKEYTGTEGMIKYLQTEYKKVSVMDNKFVNEFRLQKFLSTPMPKEPEKALTLKGSIGREYLNAGHPEKAIEAFKEYMRFAKENNLKPKDYMYMKHLQAMSYMRAGEIQNCYQNHSAESCIFPVQGNGIHKDKSGSTAAIEVYKEILQETEKNSEDYLVAVWLLNIAYMTIGEYPQSVPKEYLINPAKLKSSYTVNKFTDVASSAGVGPSSLSGGSSMEDFNGDGYLDIMNGGWQFFEQLQYFENNGDGTFTDKTEQAGLKGLPGGLNMTHADYDNDGDADVLVFRGAWWDKYGCTPNSLLRNNGNGTFTDVTKEAGVLSLHPDNSGKFEDFNNDGWLDLFVGNESTTGSNNHACELFINNKNGTFTNFAKEAGIDVKDYVKGVATGDYDNDGYTDVFLSVFMKGKNRLFRNVTGENNGKIKFEETTDKSGITKPDNCFPTWFFDYDNDGWLDLFVASFNNDFLYQIPAHYLGVPYPHDYSALYHNNGDGTFTEVGEKYGLGQPVIAMGSNFGDIDNDGWLDFYLGTGNPDIRSIIPNLMFRNNEGKEFQDVTFSSGLGHLQKGHGVSFGDIDMDGDQDIYEDLGGAIMGDFFNSALFENPGQGNNWITIMPQGVTSNRSAIGARIKITVSDSSGNKRTIYNVVNNGGSFGSNSLRAEIGLGNAAIIDEIEIYWPASKIKQIFANVQPNQVIKIMEDKNTFEIINIPSFQFKHAEPGEMHHDHNIMASN